jgi:hypothetical protein
MMRLILVGGLAAILCCLPSGVLRAQAPSCLQLQRAGDSLLSTSARRSRGAGLPAPDTVDFQQIAPESGEARTWRLADGLLRDSITLFAEMSRRRVRVVRRGDTVLVARVDIDHYARTFGPVQRRSVERYYFHAGAVRCVRTGSRSVHAIAPDDTERGDVAVVIAQLARLLPGAR